MYIETMYIIVTALHSISTSCKVVQIFKNWTTLRLTVLAAINWRLGLDLSPVSPTNGADPASVRTSWP